MNTLQITPELVSVAQSLLQQIFNLVPPVLIGGVQTHMLSEKQYYRHGFKFKVWSLISNNKKIYKGLSLKSKTGTHNSIDTADLYQ